MLSRNSLKNFSFVHPFETVTEQLAKISLLPMPHQSITSNKKNIKNLILLPKVAWTFYAKNINIINETTPAYLYRQHEGQTYGNIKNINEERTIFRYGRIYSSLKVIENNPIFKKYKNELLSSKVIALFMLRKVSYKIIF